MIDELTATRPMITPSIKIIMHGHPPDRDHRGPSQTLRMDLRMRWCIPNTSAIFESQSHLGVIVWR
jgi:hypothetical protein